VGFQAAREATVISCC